MAKSAGKIDVLMSPHHGSKTSNTPALADWARPQVVVSCQRRPVGTFRSANVFEAAGDPISGHLAARCRYDSRRKRENRAVETFRTKEVLAIKN